LGKYRIERRIARGGFAEVYRAFDTVEGISVAVKIPHRDHTSSEMLARFRREARLVAKLDHPNILPIKNADMIDDRFVIVSPLGDSTLYDRLRNRMSARRALSYAEQMLDGLACAHSHRIIHCDLKPENLILFGPDRLRLADFGIAKVAQRTVPAASGSGTVGYMAPEQAMGRPSFRSDVFSAGLVVYRLFSGVLPEWPFLWPPPGFDKVRRKLHPDMVELLRRCMELDHRKRYPDALRLLTAFRRLRNKTLGHFTARSRRRQGHGTGTQDWRQIRLRQFQRAFGRVLETRSQCKRCGGAVGETMRCCPWCGRDMPVFRDTPRFSHACGRCGRGMKPDWRFCMFCYGASYEPGTARKLADRRYAGRCDNGSCGRKTLMPFMRYCPWCRAKVQRPWPIPGRKENCNHCGWGILREFWSHCPWCTRRLETEV
jgi:serine/threonine-protein kinase